MVYTDMTKKAMCFCFEAHKNQQDKSGLPYVFHPFHLTEEMDDEISATVALLHDVMEDTDYTLEDLRRLGFPEDVLEALELMTHGDDTLYMDYVAKIRSNPIATKVKLADLRHNSDLTRLNTIDERALNRVKKYQEAIKLLEK